jgi:hypothetical protein
VGHIDGTGAVLLARYLDRLAASGHAIHVVKESNRETSNLITLYLERRSGAPPPAHLPLTPVARLGAVAAEVPGFLISALDFTGLACHSSHDSAPPPTSRSSSSSRISRSWALW